MKAIPDEIEVIRKAAEELSIKCRMQLLRLSNDSWAVKPLTRLQEALRLAVIEL